MSKKQLIITIISIIVAAALAITGILIYQELQLKNTIITYLSNALVQETQQSNPETDSSEGYNNYIVEANTATLTKPDNIPENQVIDANMALLTRLYHYLENNYLWDIDHDEVYEAMATAMFDTLGDKYTYYVKADESEEYEEETTGKYGGLGFYFSKTYLQYQDPADEETLYCNISQVFPNTPSSRGGIKAGDRITHINGESVIPLEADECAKLMKGDIGTSVTVTIKRKNTSFDLVLTRELVTVPTVEYTMLENHMGYIQILQFNKDTYPKVVEALNSLKLKGLETLIIDLRDNPGGDVDIALSIANLFISKDDLLKISYKDESKNITFKATSPVLLNREVPMAVLINGGTASSAEILSSTLKDNKRAVLIGTTTYGKGIMQTISSFGTGWTSITTASFVPPSGDTIHEVGVLPDIEVDSIYIEDSEIDAYTELLDSKIVSDYVKENPEFSVENVKRFVELHPEINLRPVVTEIVVRNEYYLQMTYDEQPIADTLFDPQIIKAVEVLSFK